MVGLDTEFKFSIEWWYFQWESSSKKGYDGEGESEWVKSSCQNPRHIFCPITSFENITIQ
jgi:hypothetical protein